MIGIVVVHYEDPRGLDRVLTALASCAGEADLAVVVADDGSATAPRVGPRPYPVTVVRQEDRGFRAAAARNLGARTLLEQHDVVDALLFLDGDTIPSGGYVDAMVRALRERAGSAPGRRALVVGRRRYADLSGLSTGEVVSFVDSPAPDRILPDTAWLDEGYATTHDLRNADDRSYRFVISAVLATTPELFEATGGFDESFVGYGGEDWEFAYRAWLAGADLLHEPAAVAWHDGPDAGGRDERDEAAGLDPDDARRRRSAESLRLARTITEPGARDPGLLWEHPDVVVVVDDRGCREEDVLLTCADLVRGSDAAVWLREGKILEPGWWPRSDPRVRRGTPDVLSYARARYRVYVDRPIRLAVPLSQLCEQAPLAAPGIRLTRTRDVNRGVPLSDPTPHPHVRATRPDASLEAEWGWRSVETLPVASTPSRKEPS